MGSNLDASRAISVAAIMRLLLHQHQAPVGDNRNTLSTGFWKDKPEMQFFEKLHKLVFFV